MKGFVRDAYCGLYCAACPLYQATEAGTAGELKCKGCKSEQVAPGWCSDCSIKACAQRKGYDSCAECDERPCAMLDGFAKDEDYQYHAEVSGYLDMIKAKGKAVWLGEMEKRWSCPACGTRLDWYAMKCPACGAHAKGYPKVV